MAQDNDFLAAVAGAGRRVITETAFDREDIRRMTESPHPSIGDKTARELELVASARDILVDSPADIQKTPADVSHETPCASDADPPATVRQQHTQTQRNSSRRRQETTRHEGLQELPQPALESVENNPLWVCADSELKREHGYFYRRVFRKTNSDQHDNQEPGALTYDPVRRATFMGFKIISLSFLPLATTNRRFIWSLFQLICAVGVAISHWVFRDNVIYYCNQIVHFSEERCLTCSRWKVSVSILVFLTLFLVVVDFAVCTIHMVRQCSCTQCRRPVGEGRPLLNDGRTRAQTNTCTKCKIIVNMWNRYSDFLRIVVFDALFYAIFSLDTVLSLSCSLYYYTFLSVIASGITSICCVIFVQFPIFVALLCRSTCHKPHQTTGSRTVGFLLAFILNFIFQRAFQGYIASLSFTASNFDDIIENENGTEIIIGGDPPNTLAVDLFGGYLVSILGILTFFVLVFSWAKTVFIKPFRDFLISLYCHQQNGQCSQEDWERIQYVLDGYEYNALSSSPELARKETYFTAPIQNHLLGILMVPFLVSLGLLLFHICQGESSKPHCYASISLGLLFNLLYVMVGTVWLFYAIITILSRFVSYSIGALSSSHDENIVLHR